MHVGFTGTRNGMTEGQKATVRNLLLSLRPEAVHHGDCVGADEQFHAIARDVGVGTIVVHPPDDDTHRAFCAGDLMMPPKPYLVRNWAIVDESCLLLATPKGYVERTRSGTWTTVRHARTRKKKLIVVFPGGETHAQRRVKRNGYRKRR